MNREKAERYLKIGLFGAALTLIGDLLIGAIVMFTALLLGWKKCVGDKEPAL